MAMFGWDVGGSYPTSQAIDAGRAGTNRLTPIGQQQVGAIGQLQGFANQAPWAANAGMGQSAGLQALAGTLNGAFAGNLPYASQALTNAFDPQQALYKQNLADLTDATRAGEAVRGISMSPYGAGVEANAIGRFQNDWQDRQVQRQMTGAQTATALQGQYQSGQEAAGRLINESGQLDQNNMKLQLERYGLQGETLAKAIQAMNQFISASAPSGGGARGGGLGPDTFGDFRGWGVRTGGAADLGW